MSWCQFGEPYRKHTTLGFTDARFLQDIINRICRGGHPHIPLEGSLTSKASEYPRMFCEETAEKVVYARNLAGSFVSRSLREGLGPELWSDFSLTKFRRVHPGLRLCKRHAGARGCRRSTSMLLRFEVHLGRSVSGLIEVLVSDNFTVWIHRSG